MGKVATGVLVFWLIAIGGSVGFAQDNRFQNAELNKKACDFLSKADAESILGQPVELRATNATQCWYVETGWTNKPPKNKHVRFEAWFWTTPQHAQFAETRKALVEHPPPSAVVKDVPAFGDAAIWLWAGSGGTLYAFKGGTIQVDVMIAGIPEDQALQHAKALASKPLGGTAGTGYVYLGTPKGDAGVAAKAAADAAAEAAALAKLLQQGKTFSQAPYITESQFLKLAKEVSLTFETAPSLEKYIPAAEQRNIIERALADYGISVRSGAPITLQATVLHHVNVLTKTFYQGGSSSTSKWPIHTIELSLKFFVRGGAWRNGSFHLVAAAPAYASQVYDLIEDNDAAKSIYGDDTVKRIKIEFLGNVTDSQKKMASNTKAETAPGYVNSWTAKDKAAADAEFVKLVSARSLVEKRPLNGITTAPELELESAEDHDFCTKPDSSWRGLWSKAFQRVGLAATAPQPALRLRHFVFCHFNSGFTPVHYFWYYDTISLVEDNLVFELNGALVRRPAELLYSSHSADSIEAETKPSTQDFLPRSINDFVIDLAVGSGNARASLKSAE